MVKEISSWGSHYGHIRDGSDIGYPVDITKCRKPVPGEVIILQRINYDPKVWRIVDE